MNHQSETILQILLDVDEWVVGSNILIKIESDEKIRLPIDIVAIYLPHSLIYLVFFLSIHWIHSRHNKKIPFDTMKGSSLTKMLVAAMKGLFPLTLGMLSFSLECRKVENLSFLLRGRISLSLWKLIRVVDRILWKVELKLF